MSVRAQILSRFGAHASGPAPLLLDLTLWYDTHAQRGSLPPAWQGMSLPAIAAALQTAAFAVVRPWRVDYPGVDTITTETGGTRTTETRTAQGTLTARWSLGPDGNWWQTEYPVKTTADLDLALAAAEARTYTIDAARLAAVHAAVGDDGLVAVEVPTRPYIDLLYDLVGMSEGFMLLMEDPPAARQLVAVLEGKLQGFAHELTQLPGDLYYSPDNLDGQFVYPAVFADWLAASYETSTSIWAATARPLVVHAGGPVGQLLRPLAAAGVSGVEGIAPPPQSDASLKQARALAGPDLTLWGGIAQDFLLNTGSEADFEAAVAAAADEANQDPRSLLGVADRVPVDAVPTRLEALCRRAISG
jgi:hypothetical protein